MAEALEAVTGESLKPVYVLAEGSAEPEPPAAEGGEKMNEEELMERLKSEFDAEEVS